MYRCVATFSAVPSQLICASASISKVSPSSQIPIRRQSLLVLATAGNVTSPRPGIWDMLGRAKWCLCSLVYHLLRLTSSQGCMGKAQRSRSLRGEMVIRGCSPEGLFPPTDDLHACLNLYKVLRKYPDKTVARDHVREIESFGGDPANLVHSGMTIRCVEPSNANNIFRNLFEVTRFRFFKLRRASWIRLSLRPDPTSASKRSAGSS
jgi:hypothetical protein